MVEVTASERDRLSVNNTFMGTMSLARRRSRRHRPCLVSPISWRPCNWLRCSQWDRGPSWFICSWQTKMEICFWADGNPGLPDQSCRWAILPLSIREWPRNLDFFKAGFRVRYVYAWLWFRVDVHTKEGNMKEYHGSATIGLILRNLSLKAPVTHDRTAFQIALWTLVAGCTLCPAIAIAKQGSKRRS